MDLTDMEYMSSGCEGKNCSLASGFQEDCSNQDCYWEEPMFGLIGLVCVTVIYVQLMLLGLLGNILTILVVCLRPHMRSSTYLYLSSMAVSDLLILLLLPLDLYKESVSRGQELKLFVKGDGRCQLKGNPLYLPAVQR
ncbi:hypothetical protein ILYODFUR_010484 [Ilyodon furcidens]|uniref:G-protein coupled receptors family 1 profile domain-containing protein n=1 Tax=Ilyodon furcidens TaxID=33524 RepID=A0ABV0V4G8_9TELE